MTTNAPATLSNKPARRFWGWGYLRDVIADEEKRKVDALLAWLGGGGAAVAEPRADDFTLAAPRVGAPAALAAILSSSVYDRLTHCYGKSFPDVARMWMREAINAPDYVAFPRDESEIVDVLDWASRNRVAVVPFGGGTSVVGGVEAAIGADAHNQHVASVSLDMERFDRVLEIDRVSRAARIQAGVLGPDLESQLRESGLTLRHFPQSFQFSTLGGWIATRAGGHYATLYTHIDDFVESTRMVTPAGVIETRRLPASGAGPAPDRLVIGSEGTLGVITEAWMRLQDRPRFRASASVRFKDMQVAVQGVRALSQSGLHPTNCRLLDPAEVAFAGVGDRKSPTLVLGFESADHAVQAWMTRALELVADHGGEWDAMDARDAEAVERAGEHRKGVAGAWRDAFIRMPYLRDETTRRGAILDTFESAVTWDRFEAFYAGVLEDVGEAIARITGAQAPVSCRFTHVYPDGPAPYFTYAAIGSRDGDLRSAVAKWREIKAASNAAVVRHGGTSTHHHAVGRDHRSAYEIEVPALMRAALAGAKKVMDPAGVMNPGCLF
jgi:alkyldihydroxyacetonephosphate synthase